MSPEGWITMIVSIGVVISITTWCFIKIFSKPNKEEDLHGIELITPDMEEEKAIKEYRE